MQFDGAVIKEQGLTFAVVVVKRNVIDNSQETEKALNSFRPIFPSIPIVFMAQDHSGRPTYCGRPDIARFLSRVPFNRIPWRKYTIN